VSPRRNGADPVGIDQAEFKAGRNSFNHQFHFKLRKSHADAASSTRAERQVFEGRESSLEEALRSESLGIRVAIVLFTGVAGRPTLG
jgi:hypothetical protein